jgi:glucokinase
MKPYAVGIDIGGTNVRAAIVTQSGEIIARTTAREHAEKHPEVVIETIIQACTRVLADAAVDRREVEAVALGFGGTVNGPEGVVLVSSNLPAWDHYPLRDHVAARLGIPTLLDNDTNLGALGEHRFGAGRGVDDMAYVTISTGLGLGIIINGKLYVGRSGTAGEIGHAVIDIDGPMCTCGKRGCLMAYASGIGLSRMAYARIAAGEATLLRDAAPGDGSRIAGEAILAAANQSDRVAQEVIHTFARHCGVALAWINELLNPTLTVVGGGLTNMGDRLWQPMLASMYENTQPEIHEYIRVAPWQLGDDIGLLGAAAKVFVAAERREARAAVQAAN